MGNIKVSIITVCYNSGKTIEDTFKSILEQSYQNIEYIVIDGGSTDNTLELIGDYETQFLKRSISFKFLSEKDNGIPDAMNKGVKLSTGDLIGLINSDDWYTKDIISKMVDFYFANNKPDIIHANIDKYSESKQFIQTNHPTNYPRLIWYGMIYQHPSCFVKSSAYQKVGTFNLEYKIGFDYDFMLACFKAGLTFAYFNTSISCMRYGGISDTFLVESWKETMASSIQHGLNPYLAKLFYWIKVYRKRVLDG